MTRCDRHDGDPASGVYANYFEVGYNAYEVIIAFGQRYEDSGTHSCHTRIVTTPSFAKTLFDILGRSLREYEERYGPILP